MKTVKDLNDLLEKYFNNPNQSQVISAKLDEIFDSIIPVESKRAAYDSSRNSFERDLQKYFNTNSKNLETENQLKQNARALFHLMKSYQQD